jgi:hypothetical protein
MITPFWDICDLLYVILYEVSNVFVPSSSKLSGRGGENNTGGSNPTE